MATLTELGRNSSVVTYGLSSTGSDQWPALALTDQWLRNDTMQGTVIASGSTVTGTGTIFTTQLRTGDQIMIAGQSQNVASVITDTSLTTLGSFVPSVSIPSSLKQISTLTIAGNGILSGNTVNAVRGNTFGTVSVTNGSTTVTGNNTFFLPDVTNAVNTVLLTGTVALDGANNITGTGTQFVTGQGGNNGLFPGDSINIGANNFYTVATVTSDTAATVYGPTTAITSGSLIAKAQNGVAGLTIRINGRVRQVASIISNTQLTVNIPMDFTDSNLRYATFPRGTVSVLAGSTTVVGSGTNFQWDLVTGDQVLLGDELRTINFFSNSANSNTSATISDFVGWAGPTTNVLRQSVFGIPFWRDESYLTGVNTQWLNELRVGDDIIVDGTEATVTAVLSNNLIKINTLFTHNTSISIVYKKKKVHGYVLEGTREGPVGGKLSTAVTANTTANSIALAGNTSLTLSSNVGFSQFGIVKVQGGGGLPLPLNGYINTVAGSSTITGTSTNFTTQLHVGAEIVIAGQYLTVTAIASDTSLTVAQTVTVTGPVPYYRSTPLYTYIASISANTLTLGTPLKNTIYSNGSNPPSVYTPSTAADFVEYVYSSTNYSAEQSYILSNTSYDRKYFGFRYYPLAVGGGTANTITTSGSAYNVPVYERWVASYGQGNGVGINLADQSGGAVFNVSQSTNTLTVNSVASGSITIGMVLSGGVGTVTAFGSGSGGTGTYTVSGSQTLTNAVVTGAISGVTDQTPMTQTTGGFLYLFASNRWFMIQGKSYANLQQQWLGCFEFERSQPEDTGGGFGTSSGVSYYTGNPVSGTPGISPWPCYAYFNGQRFPVGSTQVPTAPVAQTIGVHGGIFSVPRVRNSTGDLVGLNSHVYTGATITSGRWGHMYELGAGGSYNAPTTAISVGAATLTANTIPQPHVGQIVPVYTNVYNSKRFMFSPIVVLGPAYDPDIRGRIYGLKVIPSNLGTLMDTVSVTVDSNYFYNSAFTTVDHWITTASVQTYRFSLGGINNQSTRSLEDSSTLAANTSTTFQNNFRWAIPA